MALKITLKPNEKMILGGTVVLNGGSRSDLIIEYKVPILRQNDILSEKDANSPSKRIYFAIQLMYIDSANLPTYHQQYWQLANDLVKAAPSFLPYIEKINKRVLNGHYYQALKLVHKMIALEQEVIREQFIVHKIGYESVDFKFIGFPDVEPERVKIGK